MKIYAALGLAALMTGFGVAGAHAQAGPANSIYVYNFNDAVSPAPTGGSDLGTLFSVDRVNQGAAANGSALSTTFAAANVTNFGGTTVNGDGPDATQAAGTNNQALALQAGTNQVNNGQSLTATANLTGFQNIGFSFAGQATGSGFKSDTLSYSTDGGANFTDFATITNLPAAFQTAGVTNAGAQQTFNFSSIAGLNNNANAAFRLTFNGATGATGNNRLDNLIIAGDVSGGAPVVAPVPEASTTVSLGLMLALGGLAVAVKKKKANVAL